MKWKNKLTSLLKIEYPILQAPMLVVSTPEMVAAVSNENCLGILPLGYASPEKAKAQITKLKTLTGKPFAVNVFPYVPPQLENEIDNAPLRRIFQKYNVPFFDTVPDKDPFESYESVLNLVIEERIPAVSFHFGIPSREVMEKLKANGIITLATATSVKEADMIESAGIDIVVAQGIEAGGNRGTFIEEPLPQVGLFSLLPQIADKVKIPVIAAGGIMDGRTVAAALMLGASGVQIGSALIRAKESGAPNSWKQAVAKAGDTSTVLTNVWSGRYGRCLENEFTKEMSSSPVYPSPIQHYLTSKLREAGRAKDLPGIQSLWAGQSAHYAKDRNTKDIIRSIIKEAEEKFPS
jgi:nitronate monooxygenase